MVQNILRAICPLILVFGLVPTSNSFAGQPPAQIYKFKRNATFSNSVQEHGFTSLDVHQMVEASKEVQDLNLVRTGTEFSVLYEKGPIAEPYGIEIKLSKIRSFTIQKVGADQWKAELQEQPTEVRIMSYTGVVGTSLWNSALDAQMDPYLISELTEVFAWQIDFSREVRLNDRWRLTVEQIYANGEPVGWGKILGAEYQNDGTVYTAILYRRNGEDVGYFFPDGRNLKRMFLKAPMKFGRISSRFQRKRFHPILKRYRPHLGVDYAAPTGTPIRAVGAGTITTIGRRGGAGKMIRIRHNSVYETAYKHMSRFAPGMRYGRRVEQGQIIGYVGSTGLASGPHLHFEFFENKRYVDPLGRKFPSADPVPRDEKIMFDHHVKRVIASLPPWFYVGVVVSGPVEISEASKAAEI